MNCDILKAFFIVTRHHVYFSRICNYASADILAENGFKNWQRLYDFDEGFCCCQYRPFGVDSTDPSTGKWARVGHDYALPFEKWKFNLRHQPACWPHPRWVNVGELQDRTFPLLPEWSRHHIIREGEAFCPSGYSRLALGNAVIHQSGGTAWAYENSQIVQGPGSREGLACLFDNSKGEIYSFAMLSGRAQANIYPGAGYQIHSEQAQVIIHEGPMPKWGPATLARCCGRGINLPFGLPVESL